MTTGLLHATTTRPRQAPQGLETLFRTPVPPFHMVFPAPDGCDKDHPLYELHRAANRVYHERRRAYQAKGESLSAPDLVDFIRKDICSNLLATRLYTLGPIEVPVYAFLNARRFWAFFPWHRERAEALLVEFKKTYRKRRRASGRFL